MNNSSSFSLKNGRIEGISIGVNTAEVLLFDGSDKHVCLVFHGTTSVHECNASYEEFAEFKIAPLDNALKKYSFLSAAQAALLEIIAEGCDTYKCDEAQDTLPLLFGMFPEL